MKIISMVFLKKISSGQMRHFRPKNDVSSYLWISSNSFFEILHNEKGQEVRENYINDFSEKNIFSAIGPFLAAK